MITLDRLNAQVERCEELAENLNALLALRTAALLEVVLDEEYSMTEMLYIYTDCLLELDF